MAELERLLIRLDATTEGLRRELQAADGRVTDFSRRTDRNMLAIEKSFQRASVMFASAFSANAFLNAAREMQNLEARLKATTGSSEAAAQAMDYLRKVASEQAVDLSSLADGFNRLLPAVKSGKLSFQEMDNILVLANDNIKAFGLSASEAEGLFLGLSQALGSGTVTMEDLRQVTDRLPGSLDALAAALGKDVAQFKEMVAQGNFTAEMLKGPLIEAFKANEGAAKDLSNTFDSQMARMKNAFSDLADALGDSGLLDVVSYAVMRVTQAIQVLDLTITAMGMSFNRITGDMNGYQKSFKAYNDLLDRMNGKFEASTDLLDQLQGKGGDRGFKGLTKEQEKAAKAQDDLNKKLQEMLDKQEFDSFIVGMDEGKIAVESLRFELDNMAKSVGGFNQQQQQMSDLLLENAEYLEKKKENYKELTKAQDEAKESAERAAEEYAEAMRRPIENALEGIQDTITDTFVGMFDGSIDSAADAADSIKRIFLRMAAELATLELFGSGGFDIAGMVRGNALGRGNAGSSGGGGFSSLDTLSNLSGITKAGFLSGNIGGFNAINRFGADYLGTGLVGKGSVTGASLSGIGLNAGIGGTIAGLAGLNSGNMAVDSVASLAGSYGGSALASAAGFGSFAGPAGIIGAVALSALAGSAFGKSRPHPVSTFAIDRTDGVLDLNTMTYRSKHLDDSVAQGLASSFTPAIQSLMGSGFNLASAEILAGGVDDGRGFFTTGDYKRGTGKTTFFNPNDPASQEAALTQFIAELARESTNLAEIMDAEMIEAVRNLKTEGRSLADVIAEINFAATRDDLRRELEQNVLLEATEAALPGFTAIRQEIDRYTQQLEYAKELGADGTVIMQIQQIHQKRLADLSKQTANVQEDTARAARQAASELARRFESLSNGFGNIIADLTTGNASGLTPMQQYNQLRGRINELSPQARLGNLEAMAELEQLLPAFYNLSGEINGFNADFEEDRRLSLDIARSAQSVAQRQMEIQLRIAEASETTAAALQGRMMGGAAGNANNAIVAAIQSGRLSEADAHAIIRAAGFGGIIGGGRVQSFFDNNAAANQSAFAALSARGIRGYAFGGLVDGMPGVEQNLARLSKGEFVMQPASVARIGSMSLQAINDNSNGVMAQIAGLNEKMDTLIRVVSASGQVTSAQLEKIAGINADAKALQKAVAYTGRK